MVKKSKQGTSLLMLTNIGKITAAKLQKIGITTAEDFCSRNPYEVFNELLHKVDPTLCRCALACIVGARMNVRWNEIRTVAAKEFEKQYPKTYAKCWEKQKKF
jgi:hypothetical protein